MTIFRFSAVICFVLLFGCAENLPPSNTELGRIVRIDSAIEKAAALKRYAYFRRGDHSSFSAELKAANFQYLGWARQYSDRNERCEAWRWEGSDWFAVDASVSLALCGEKVETHAGHSFL